MDHINNLIAAVTKAQKEDDLPDFLALRIVALAERLAEREDLSQDVMALAEQVALYDTYGQTGYIGMGVDSEILSRAIRRLETKINS